MAVSQRQERERRCCRSGFAAYILEPLGWNESWARAAGGAGAALLIAALAASGLRRSNRVNAVLVASTCFALLLFVGYGSYLWISAPGVGAVSPEAFWSGAGAASDPGWSLNGFFTATALAFVAYTGYGRVATLGEEVRDPARTIPRAIVITVAVVAVLYLTTGFTAYIALGAKGFAAAAREAAPLELAASVFGAPWLRWILAVGAITAMAGVLLNLVLGLSRVLFAMARQNDAPAPLAAVSSSRGPVRATLAMGAVIALMALPGDVAAAWSFSAAAVLLYYAVTNLAALRLSREQRRLPALIPALGLLGCLLFFAFVDWRAIVAALVVLLIGFGFRALSQRLASR